MAPPASQLPRLMDDLFGWLARSTEQPLIASAVFHYEFEFIHPFADGNGRMGRFWQTLSLLRWRPLFADLPVESLVHRHQAAYYQAIGRRRHRKGPAWPRQEACKDPYHAALARGPPRPLEGDWSGLAEAHGRSSGQGGSVSPAGWRSARSRASTGA